MNALEQVISDLKKRRGEWPAIAQKAGVPYFTLTKICQGVTKNPRWKTVAAIQAALEDEKRVA